MHFSIVKPTTKYYKNKTGTRYCKYDAWNQPVLTSNTTSVAEGDIVCTASSWFQNSSENNQPYNAMDGVKSGTSNNTYWGINESVTGFWQVKFPYKLKIKGITYYNRYSSTVSQVVCEGRFYTSDAKTTPIGDAFTTSATNWQAVTISGIPSDGIETDTIYFDKTGGTANAGIGELDIVATLTTYHEVASTDNYDFTETYTYAEEVKEGEDYDFSKVLLIPYVIVRPTTKYYKNKVGTHYYKYLYGDEETFSPEGEISNTDGWSNVANAFDNDASTYASCGTSTDYIDVVLGENIKVSGFTISGNYASEVARTMGMRMYNVEGDAEVLLAETSIPSSSTTYTVSGSCDEIVSNQLRFRLSTKNSAGDAPTTRYPTRIREIQVTGKRIIGSVEVTSSDDYDFYESYTYVEEVTENEEYDYSKEVLIPYVIVKEDD